jgi:hypothetical protein
MRMSESTKAALAASVAVGYMLGRSRKGKLAMTVAAYLASKKLQAKPQELLAAGAGKLGESPEVSRLVEQVRGEVLNVGREALKALADRQLGSFADALAQRTSSLGQALDAAQEKPEEEEEEETESARGEEETGDQEGEEGAEKEKEKETEAESESERGGRRRAEDRTRPRRPRRDSETPSAPTKKASQKSARNAPPSKSAKKKTTRKPPAESSPARR